MGMLYKGAELAIHSLIFGKLWSRHSEQLLNTTL